MLLLRLGINVATQRILFFNARNILCKSCANITLGKYYGAAEVVWSLTGTHCAVLTKEGGGVIFVLQTFSLIEDYAFLLRTCRYVPVSAGENLIYNVFLLAQVRVLSRL